ncbi:hypothetical protein CIHG_02783 [Coccidioides immitis H538.4]|uniref:Uncharacterized protein n=1 Tax=Coccidioides immitis H538.4 TaxID=396776 RepID=A0A0J8RIP9_COCIT|nr:hypothetical protein CIHG_02783 [Coccidioides immitis H538.4]
MSLQTKDQPPTEHASTKSPASVRLDQLGSQYVRGSHSADCYFKKRRFFPELLAGLKVKYKWNQRTREMKKLRRCWSFVSVLGAGTSQRFVITTAAESKMRIETALQKAHGNMRLFLLVKSSETE